MISVLVGSSVAPENLEGALTVYRGLVAATLKEPGCVSYELLQLRDDDCELMLAERWLSQEHLDAHTRTKHFIEAMHKLETLETAAPALIFTSAV
ncbi:putative quinol monooxygenase [Arthrobacter sp. GMC3]|uniref:putative quinol monooxygenase n=1 Tax=Arthrobacter sp. GMC3 TaxID=2058894 RepID=UPI000CE2C954|nr:putative quinol monooxygenase [Arthrobacter sp. GMC3]